MGPFLLPEHTGHSGFSGAVYICTEDAFPSKRLWQLIEQQQKLRTDVPEEVTQKIRFSDHIFIEHVADVVSVCDINRLVTQPVSLVQRPCSAQGKVRMDKVRKRKCQTPIGWWSWACSFNTHTQQEACCP